MNELIAQETPPKSHPHRPARSHRANRQAAPARCACCDRPLRPGEPACDHARELWAQARARARAFHDHPRTAWCAPGAPWLQRPLTEVGLAWPESAQVPLANPWPAERSARTDRRRAG